MLSQDQDVPFGLVADLAPVAQAAGARLRAETDADAEAARAAAEALVSAATGAMAAGQSLSDITQAEARGQEEVRNALRGDTLRSVERTGRRAREARIEHHQAIARAVRLGLSTREIATAAQLTHGTVRAISNRLAAGGAGAEADGETHGDEPWEHPEPEEEHPGEEGSAQHNEEW